MKIDIILWVMCGLGFALHLFKKWGDERTKTPGVGLSDYLKHTRAQWIASLIASIACMGMLPALPGILGLPAESTPEVLMRVVAFLAGYMGSSLVVSVTGKVAGRIENKQQ